MTRWLGWRLAGLLALIGLMGLAALALRRIGLAEAAVLAVLLALAFGLESLRFIWRQFRRGLRGPVR